ncbi:Rv3235 family protein [Streptomyces sp. HUAS MG47]|uniref:Rv3235 family protein n=1 Tax=Streptomyces solicamelliae TaxID=3231716 RepID=UPI0038783FC8
MTGTTRPRSTRPRTTGPGNTRPGNLRPGGLRPGDPRRTPPRALPPYALFAERLLAVLSGERPVHWMLGQTVGPAYEQLVRLAPDVPFGGVRPVLRRCRVQGDTVAADATVMEVSAVVATGERVRAMAFRLERPAADHRWRCAAVELDDLPPRVPAQSRGPR